MIGFSSAYASAATPVWLLRAKAGIAAAMLASNLIINPINAAVDDTLLEGIDPIGYVQQIQTTPWTDYIDMSTIVVRPDVVEIDGEPYSQIWLGPDAANSLRLTGLDFASAYNILANQSQAIQYASGWGDYGGVPLYSVDGGVMSQAYYCADAGNYSIGPINFTVKDTTGAQQPNVFVDGNQLSPNSSFVSRPANAFIRAGDDYARFRWSKGASPRAAGTSYTLPVSYLNKHTFAFDYTSGQIDAVPDPEDGLMLTVPSSYNDGQTGSVFNYDIHDLVNIYPQVDDTRGHDLVFDPNLNPDFQVDLDMGNALGDIITAVILAKLADLLGDDSEVIYAPMPEKDEPIEPGIIDPLPDPDPAPDIPQPGTTIADTDWTLLDKLLRWIQSTIDSIRHITEALQTMLDSIIEGINDIHESIRELADKILEDIELGPSKLFDKALDILKTLFLPLLLPIRAMMNLWHYVVEWIGSISSPFTWIFGIMSGTSGNMVLPIYALLAGGICISIYKALGR